MRYLRQYTILAIAGCLSFAACKKSDSTPGNAPIIATDRDTMYATVNGAAWSANTHSFGAVTGGGPGYLEVSGTDSAGEKSVMFFLNDLGSSPKSYSITTSGADSGSYYSSAIDKHMATGTVKIIGITDNYIQGTFELSAGGNTITGGVFNYKL